MVMPLFDDNSDRRTVPIVNYALIAVNILVFVFPQGLGENQRFTYAFATVPYEIMTGKDVQTPPQEVTDPVTGVVVTVPGLEPTPIPVYLTLVTAMFMHGGLAHLLGNMLFLWIFGDNVEDVLGHVRYLIFYLSCGVASGLAQVLMTVIMSGLESDAALVPCLGASGAISGVLGAYLWLFPQRRVTVILFRILTQVPAYVAIGIWFVFQLISGLGILGRETQLGGVAYAAHVGGFVVGIPLTWLFTLDRDLNRRRPYW